MEKAENKFEIEKLRNVIVEYKIPMAFDLQNCIKEGDEGKPFLVVVDNVPARIRIERIYESRYKNEGFQVAPFSKIEEDRGGMLSHSKVQIWFDSQTFNSDRIDKDIIEILPDQFLYLSIEYINKFIKTYKNITNEYWLRSIIKKDIFNVQYVLIDTNNNKGIISILIPSHHTVQFNGGNEFKLNEENEEIFRASLQSNYYNFRQELNLNMLDNFSLGYYDVALLQSVIIFENFIYSNLKTKLSNTKLDKIKKKEDCGCMVGISEICQRGLKEYFDVDFGSTEEFENLKDNALKYRNLIVHGELSENIDKETCEKGLEAVKITIDYLVEKIFHET
ncbi:MAG: hypothetical protein LWX55_16575 [Deltaproteobacteria bacterium]|nr:hypothetical protein [Deltaproteobacteria bacterium]